ncbi:MAG: ABC transporter permease [Spirochaetales bacterium]|nr:ABC transporter permease [Spirochaetales bacterium]MCF7937411.1 ABC transporter permease [Spirochaetales bacterium]
MPKLDSKQNAVYWIDRNRIYIIFLGVFLVMSIFAPNFVGLRNFTNILRSMSLNATVAIGFTLVLIIHQLDLSVGSTLSLGAVFTIGFRLMFSELPPGMAWTLGVVIALAAGSLIGLINGLLVAKAKIHSFIVTLGMMIIVQGVIYMYTDVSLSATTPADFALSDFMRMPFLDSIRLLTPRILIAILSVVGMEVLLKRTRFGRNFYMVGGNRDTAWLAGLKADTYTILAFVFAGFFAALGGSMVAIEMSSSPVDLGVNSLLIVVAATIIGGTSMMGGKGSVFKTMIAVLMLETLFNGMNRFNVGTEFKIFASGMILAGVVLYEAYYIYKHEQLKGQRAELLKELEDGRKT